MRSSRFAFCLVASLAITSAACGSSGDDTSSSEDDVASKRSTLSILEKLPVDTTWAALSDADKRDLAKNARAHKASYEKRFDADALRGQIASLEKPSKEAADGFDAYVRASFGQLLKDAEGYRASTSMSPALKRALQKLYVVRIAAWRLNAKNYGNLAAVEVDGVTAIDEFPVPSEKAIATYRAIARDVVEELRAIATDGLDEEEAAIAARALDHARTHAAGSTGFRYGESDLLTVWGRGGWAYDLVFAHQEAGGAFLQDDARYAETLNAYYDVPVTGLDKGTAFALPGLTEMLVDPDFIESEFGARAEQSVAGKAYLLLTRWWLERVNADRDAQKSCTVYKNRDAMWEGFTADNLFNADGKKTLQAFSSDARAEFDRLLVAYKGVMVDAVSAFATEAKLSAAVVTAVDAAIQSESRYGELLETAAKALEGAASGSGDAFRAKFSDLPSVGGYESGQALRDADKETIAKVWQDVKSYLGSRGLDAGKLQSEIVIKADANSTVTDQAGKITIGLKTKRTEDYWYATLLHEAHHSYNQAAGVFVEGPGWEGAAKTTETYVFPELVATSLGARGLASKTPYYVAANFATRNGYAAKTEATLDVLLANGCNSQDTVERTKSIATRWGITNPALIDDVAVRSHHGTSYLQYVAGEILYTAFLKKMSAAVGRSVDPFDVQACGLTFAPDNDATVKALKACLDSAK